jgi:hypothetical protein
MGHGGGGDHMLGFHQENLLTEHQSIIIIICNKGGQR